MSHQPSDPPIVTTTTTTNSQLQIGPKNIVLAYVLWFFLGACP